MRAKKPLKPTNHPQKPNDAYENQTTQPNDAEEQTQYDNPAYEHEQTNEPYPTPQLLELPAHAVE
jgi:hypothetical protein